MLTTMGLNKVLEESIEHKTYGDLTCVCLISHVSELELQECEVLNSDFHLAFKLR